MVVTEIRTYRKRRPPAWPGPVRGGGSAAGVYPLWVTDGDSSAYRPYRRGPALPLRRNSSAGRAAMSNLWTSLCPPSSRYSVCGRCPRGTARGRSAGPRRGPRAAETPAAHADDGAQHLHPQVVRRDGVPVTGHVHRPLSRYGHIDARVERSGGHGQRIDPHGGVLRGGDLVKRANRRKNRIFFMGGKNKGKG